MNKNETSSDISALIPFFILIFGIGFICFVIGMALGGYLEEQKITNKLFRGKEVQTLTYEQFEKLIKEKQ